MFNDYNDVVTVTELARMLKIGRNTAYELVRCGVIHSIKVGRQMRIPKQTIIDFCAGSCYTGEVAAISRRKEEK
jgi:excisionase family DNA binding protein